MVCLLVECFNNIDYLSLYWFVFIFFFFFLIDVVYKKKKLVIKELNFYYFGLLFLLLFCLWKFFLFFEVHYYPCNVGVCVCKHFVFFLVEIKFAHFFLDEESVMFILDSVFLISITEMVFFGSLCMHSFYIQRHWFIWFFLHSILLNLGERVVKKQWMASTGIIV